MEWRERRGEGHGSQAVFSAFVCVHQQHYSRSGAQYWIGNICIVCIVIILYVHIHIHIIHIHNREITLRKIHKFTINMCMCMYCV